ncbi:hypothetical protein SAMN04489761_4258 [Tenacibaculum sp. MAR_2009_124]|nr:hypothetical protein SAMN04489761_4258 [Tenacibaculum sp. MAR_2009_124]
MAADTKSITCKYTTVIKSGDPITAEEYLRYVKYLDELLIYIHSHLGTVTHSRDELIALMKEHKRTSNYIKDIIS